jgi:pyruvate formate lyase activating enzyme
MVLSYGSFGCNLRCPFCQNSDIAQVRPEGGRLPALVAPVGDGVPDVPSPRHAAASDSAAALASAPVPTTPLTPEQLVARALALRPRGNVGIAYTYNEPLVGYEFVLDTARLAHEAGLANVLVTNGYVNEAPLKALLGHLDAANIDLKGFTQGFYDRVGAPRGLETVMRSIELAASHIHVEVTTLIVPGLNDDPAEIDALAQWLASVDPRIPLHLTRFHPAYRMPRTPPTPHETIRTLAAVAQHHLRRVHPSTGGLRW